jgi:hypothetical protein
MWVDLESISVGDTRLIPRSKKWIDLITQQGTINLVQVWPFISYNWLFQWDYTIYKWGFVSTYNWYFGP